jgi:glycogen operon protein
MAGGIDEDDSFEVRVHARVDGLSLCVYEGRDGRVDGRERPLRRRGDEWVGAVEPGAHYSLVVHTAGRPPRAAVDPRATAVSFPEGHRRASHRPGHAVTPGTGPMAVALAWPERRPSRRTTRPLVVYEAHVRGLTKTRWRPDAGTFRAAIDELPRLAALGVSVLELLPVHQFDPDEHNYWGYMPLVFGAVHGSYASGGDAARELADLVEAAHRHDIEIWLDVVFNHTTEEDEAGPAYNLRLLDDDGYYVHAPDGRYVDDAGTGNIVDAGSPVAQALVLEALERFADLGVDGFRFDLAAVLSRDPEFVRRIGDWAEQRGVRLVAEPWDLARYQLGAEFPDRRWMQWNDRFRDDLRGFLRGEPGLIGAVIERIGGSPDLFDDARRSINYLTAHDGFTMYDLVAYDHKHNDANGWHGADGPDYNRSWNCGWEGDEGVPEGVVELRRRQLRNAMCLLLLSRGVPMFVAGDEFGRTQSGNNNAYNQDNATSWVDWERRTHFADLESFVARLLAIRAGHPGLGHLGIVGSGRAELPVVQFFGVDGAPDTSDHSRSLAWHVPPAASDTSGVDASALYVMANMWWEPLDFRVQAPGEWERIVDTAARLAARLDDPVDARRDDRAHDSPHDTVTVAARSIVVLASRPIAGWSAPGRRR